jgi:hypothetical protein
MDDHAVMPLAVSGAPIRVENTLYNVLDDNTSEYVTYSKVTNYPTGTPMTDAICDGVLYRKSSNGEYFKRNYSSSVNVLWFGAKPDYNSTTGTGTDNYNAFMKAINALAPDLPSGQRRLLGRLNIPPGDYYIGNTIELHHAIEFVGEFNARLFFPSGKDGFILHATNTPGGTTSKYSSDGCSFRNLSFLQKAPLVRGNAFTCHVALRLFDSGMSNWGGCGIYAPSTAADPSLFKALWKVMMNVPGTGFVTAPNVILTGDGTGATATAVLGGRMGTTTVTDGGDEYWSPPSVFIGTSSRGVTEANIETLGYNARANAKMGLGKIVITNGGQNYTTAIATLSGGGGTGASLGSCTIVNGVITGIPVLAPGDEFDSPAKIIITGDGTGAAAISYLKVVRLAIVERGNDYETPPFVSFRGGRRGTGRNATATTTLDTFYVKRIQINSRGQNYTYMDVTISGGGGTGAIGTAVLFKHVLGNSNRCKVKNVNIQSCSYGIYTEGSDTNASTFEAVNISFCRYWAVHENGFLGNGYIGCICQFNLGAYMAISNTGYNTVFINCYSEDGELNSVGVLPANLYGGDHGAGIFGTWYQPDDLPSVAEITGPNGQTSIYGGDPTEGAIAAWYNSTLKSSNAATTFMEVETGDIHFHFTDYSLLQYASSSDRVYTITSPYTQQTFGRNAPTPYAVHIDRLRIGLGLSTGRALGNNSGLPTGNSYAPGDFYFNRTPSVADPILGWLRVTLGTGTNNADGVDWITVRSAPPPSSSNPILAQRSVWQNADYRLWSDNGGSIIGNFNSGMTLLTIPNSCLHLVGRPASGYYNLLNIYQGNASSGMHMGSIAAANGFISTGGYRVDGSNWKALDTVVCNLSIGSVGYLFQANSAAIVGSSATAMPTIFRITQLGKVAIGSFAPTAYLHITAGGTVAGSSQLKFDPGPLLTTPEAGVMAYDGNNFYLTPATVRKRIPLVNNVIPLAGQIPIGNGTDFTVANLVQGANITITNANGSITIASTGGGGPTFSGDYNDLTNKPYIPNKTSDLTNDSGYITAASSETLSGKSGNISMWTNDAAYLTIATLPAYPVVPTQVSAFSNDSGYLTVATLPAYPVVPTQISAFSNDAGYLTVVTLPPYPVIPTNVSSFSNDAGYLTLATLPVPDTVTSGLGVEVYQGGTVLLTGQKGDIRIPYNATITGWSILSDITGSCVFDIWKLNNALPTVANSITGSNKPTLSSGTIASSSSLTGWTTTTITAGDVIGWNLDSVSTITRAILQITVRRNG